MRVAFVIPGGGGGGVRSVLRVATGLNKRGHDVVVLHRSGRADLWDNVRQVYHSIRYGRGRGWLDSFKGRAVAYRTLTAEIAGENDAIVGVGVGCVLEMQHLPENCGVKVHNSRGVEPWCADAMRDAWSISMPRIVVGTHLVKLMREAGSMDPIYVAPNGIDASDYFPSLPESKRDGAGVVYHGAAVKDPELILEVLRRLSVRRSSMPLYVFSTFPRPATLPRKTQFVRFPSLPVARDLYSRSQVWFMASRNEGFGNPLLEAASCGCVPVSTECGGAADIIEHNQSGLLTPVGNAEALVSSIERVLDDDELRMRLRKGAQETAKRFSWDHAITSFESALKSIVRDAGASASYRYQPSHDSLNVVH